MKAMLEGDNCVSWIVQSLYHSCVHSCKLFTVRITYASTAVSCLQFISRMRSQL